MPSDPLPLGGDCGIAGAIALPALTALGTAWAVASGVGGAGLFAGSALVDGLVVPAVPLQYVVSRDPESTLYYAFDRTHQIREFSVNIDGFEVRGVALIRNDADPDAPWMVRAGGNGEFMHHIGRSPLFGGSLAAETADQIGANILTFDYPGVGAKGHANRDVMVKTYQLMLQMLEEVGVKKIIAWGDSIGGGVQGEALLEHELRHDVEYVAVKRKVFSSLRETVNQLMGSWAGGLVSALGWKMDTVECSHWLEEKGIHEIIIQEAKHNGYLTEPEEVADDDPISADASLAKALLLDKSGEEWQHKTFIGDDNGHMNTTPETLGEVVETLRRVLQLRRG